MFAFILSGCASMPPSIPQKPVNPAVTVARFHTDQQQRRAGLRQWQVSGVLEITVEDSRRRFHTKMQGIETHHAKVSIFGPMRQIIMVLFVDPQEIRLVDPEKRQIVAVPASGDGLEYLIGIGLPPQTLFEAITALADTLTQEDSNSQNSWLTQDSEKLILDPETGLIQERFGQTDADTAYHVFYKWDESSGFRSAREPVSDAVESLSEMMATKIKDNTLNGTQQAVRTEKQLPPAQATFVRMPSQIQVVLDAGETQLKYKAKQWQVPDKPFMANWFAAVELYPGFSLVRSKDW